MLRLAEALGASLREANELLHAAGLPAAYPHAELASQDLAPYRAAIERLLVAHEPYPVMVVDARYTVVAANRACAALTRCQTRTPEQLLALLTAHLQPHGLHAALGGGVGLVEGVIHHQDIRRALGRPRTVPPERLLAALRWALIAPDFGGLWRTRGVRRIATDLGFTAGAGPEARGPAEALLMTVAGRRGVPPGEQEHLAARAQRCRAEHLLGDRGVPQQRRALLA